MQILIVEIPDAVSYSKTLVNSTHFDSQFLHYINFPITYITRALKLQ